MKNYPVLMYHRIVSERCPIPGGDPEEARYSVSLAEFEDQLNYLRNSGSVGVSMRQIYESLVNGTGVPERWVAITFDDGNESDYEHALPLLADHGFCATFFVCGSRVSAPGGLTRHMIRDMAGQGMHIGAHGMTHTLLTGLDTAQVEEELVGSRDLLGEIIGETVDHFSLPGGRFDRLTLEVLKRLSFHAVCTSQVGYNDRHTKTFTYRRVPVTRRMSRSEYAAVVGRKTIRLLPLMIRAHALAVARRIFGEPVYGRLRRLGLGR